MLLLQALQLNHKVLSHLSSIPRYCYSLELLVIIGDLLRICYISLVFFLDFVRFKFYQVVFLAFTSGCFEGFGYPCSNLGPRQIVIQVCIGSIHPRFLHQPYLTCIQHQLTHDNLIQHPSIWWFTSPFMYLCMMEHGRCHCHIL